jgi:hypothetical protein
MIFIASGAAAQIGIEQYYYMTHIQVAAPVSVVNYNSPKNLYVEARHNYDAINTFSLYLGETFSGKGKLEYSITPMMGVLVGKLKGGSIAVNALVERKTLFFSTQSQYTFSHKEREENYFFAWSELGYQPCSWLFFGLSTQHTYIHKVNSWESEPGILLGFSIGKWSFPIYSFNTMSDTRYFVAGINFKGGLSNRKK